MPKQYPFAEALSIILSKANNLQPVLVDIYQSLNHILAEDVIADMDSPPFNKSSMDGYACRTEDAGKPLLVVATIFAGLTYNKSIATGTCVKIMTGAPVPNDVDCVIPIEDIENIGEKLIRFDPARNKRNICYIGEDYKNGTLLLKKGTFLTPQTLPILAAAGKTKLLVYLKPKTGIIATGSEIVEPDQLPENGKIRNSNASQLTGQLLSLGVTPNYYGIVGDNADDISKRIQFSVNNNDITILTGGVSVGEADLVPKLIEKEGFEIYIEKTNIQPGRPMVFASNGTKYIFGLSGNPVSSFLQFEYYVKPLIYQLQCGTYKPIILKLKLAADYKRKRPGTLFLHPANVAHNEVAPLEFNGSAHIFAFATANGILEIPDNITELKKGEEVNVRLI